MIEQLSQVIGDVMTMGGDPVSEILAPSEICDIAAAIAASGLLAGTADMPAGSASNISLLASLPPYLRDCFSA